MTADIIDGRLIAAQVQNRIAGEVKALESRHGIRPGLAVVLVGNDPASQAYVHSKAKQTAAIGMRSFEHRLPASTNEADLLRLVRNLNDDPEVDGILVQLPLPSQIDPSRIILAIDPEKDVDGFHPENAGRLMTGTPGLVPCTPVGSLMLIRTVAPDICGLHSVVLGRSNIVGKPMAQLLLAASSTVTIAHSQTRELPYLCRQADILIAAVGRPEMIRGNWIKPGAIVIDVGINRRPRKDGSSGSSLVGDVAFDEARAVARAITPVPGGVGPMTIASLLKNTLQAAKSRRCLA